MLFVMLQAVLVSLVLGALFTAMIVAIHRSEPEPVRCCEINLQRKPL